MRGGGVSRIGFKGSSCGGSFDIPYDATLSRLGMTRIEQDGTQVSTTNVREFP